MIRNLWQELKKFPIVLLFLAFLFCFSILDALWPKREFSELENRKLMQPPKQSGTVGKCPVCGEECTTDIYWGVAY